MHGDGDIKPSYFDKSLLSNGRGEKEGGDYYKLIEDRLDTASVSTNV